jgi:hypothetical protein
MYIVVKICPEHVELFTRIKLRNSASCWLPLQEQITMHGPLNVILRISLTRCVASMRAEEGHFEHLAPFMVEALNVLSSSVLIPVGRTSRNFSSSELG